MYAVVSSTFINKISAHILLPFLLKICIPTLELRGSYDTKEPPVSKSSSYYLCRIKYKLDSIACFSLLYKYLYLFIIVVSNDDKLIVASIIKPTPLGEDILKFLGALPHGF